MRLLASLSRSLRCSLHPSRGCATALCPSKLVSVCCYIQELCRCRFFLLPHWLLFPVPSEGVLEATVTPTSQAAALVLLYSYIRQCHLRCDGSQSLSVAVLSCAHWDGLRALGRWTRRRVLEQSQTCTPDSVSLSHFVFICGVGL